MAFKNLSTSTDIKQSRSFLSQLVDVIQSDISGSTTRKKYQVFVTGGVGVGPGVTSSLFQTVYDQDFGLQTANPIFDITIGLYSGSNTVTSSKTGEDTAGKMLFASNSLMMREKVSNYKQFAQLLLGNANSQFKAPFNADTSGDTSTTVDYFPEATVADGGATRVSDKINEALFLSFKRLFARDQIKRESFAMKFFTTAARAPALGSVPADHNGENLTVTTTTGATIFTDVGAASNIMTAYGGNVGNIVNASDTNEKIGLMWYDHGIAVLDFAKIMSGNQHVSGVIDALNKQAPDAGGVHPVGTMWIGHGYDANATAQGSNIHARFIPDFFTSASIDNIIDHVASTRFSSGSETAITFQNLTNIHSTLYFCRATADEFNYSSNPTFVNSDTSRINVIDVGSESTQRTFSFVTSVGLYDPRGNLLAVAKLSRPVEKNDEKDITFRVRLDY